MLVKNYLSIEQGRSCEGHPPPRMELAAPTSAALSASLLSPLANNQIYFEILVCLDTIITPIYFVFTDTKQSVTNIQIYFYIHTLDYCSLDNCTVFFLKNIFQFIIFFQNAQNVLQTVLEADLPQNFYVYMYLNIKFVGQFFHFHMTKKCGKVVQNFALFRLSDFCNWTLVKRGSVKKYNQRWR